MTGFGVEKKVRRVIRSEDEIVSVDPEIREIIRACDQGKYDWYVTDFEKHEIRVTEGDLELIVQWGFAPGAKVNVFIPDDNGRFQTDPLELWITTTITRRFSEGWWAVKWPDGRRELFFPENQLELLEPAPSLVIGVEPVEVVEIEQSQLDLEIGEQISLFVAS